MLILIIIAIAYPNDKKNVFNTIIISTKNERPRILLSHSLTIFPNNIIGTKVKKIINKGTISVNIRADMLYTIENINLALGSKLWTNVFFFWNLNALRNSRDIS